MRMNLGKVKGKGILTSFEVSRLDVWGKCDHKMGAWEKVRFWKEGDGISVDVLILCKSVYISKWKCLVRSMEYTRTEVQDSNITYTEMTKEVPGDEF